jgi:hypothetical protein
MPIPFIIAGVALAAGAYGVKKGFDAKSDFNDANETNEQAQRIYDGAARKLETTREKTQDSLRTLGELKFNLYQKKLIPFVAAFKKIHNIDFQHDAIEDELQLAVDQADMADIESATLKMTDIVSGGVMSLGTGGLAGLAAYGSVGLLASTAGGTAIGGLSGVAATNATLAWLGGGALSAGGLGMAGGAYVLGSIVAGPVLAVGGMMLASKAEEAKHNAYSNLSTARVAAEQMEIASVAAQGVHTRIKEIHQVLGKLEDTFEPLLDGLQSLVTHSPKNWSGKLDYMKLSKEDQVGIMVSMMMAKTIKNVLETPILDEQGLITEASGAVIDTAHNNLLEVQERLA